MGATLGVSFVIGAKLASTVSSAFASVQSKLKATQSAFSAANQKSKKLAGVIAARNRLDNLSAKMRAEGATPKDIANLQKLAEAYAKAAKNAGVYGQSLAQITRQQQEATSAAARAERSINALNRVQQGRDLRSEQTQFRKAAIANTFADIAPLGMLIHPLKIGAEFDATMSRVGAISQATGTELDAMREKARELGAKTVWSAKEAAEGMTFLSMAGFKAHETIAAMPGMLSLASAGAMDLASTADIASNILSGFGKEASEMDYVADVLAKTFTKSNTSIASLGESMKYAAPAATVAGQSFQDVAAMIGKLGDAGIQGSMAGTALNAMMIRLARQPIEAETALKQLDISVKDAAGNMRALPDILAELEAKTRKMGTVAKVDYFGRIFGMENAKSGAVLAKQAYLGEIQSMSKNLYEKGYSDNVAAQQNDNLIGDLRSLKSVYEDVGISLFEIVDPALRKITQSLIPVVRSVGEWVKANPGLVQGITLLTGAFVALKVAGLGLALINSYRKTLVGGLISMQGQVMRPIASVRNGLSMLRMEFTKPIPGGSFTGAAKQGVDTFKKRLDSLRSSLSQTITRLGQIRPAAMAAGIAAGASGVAAATGRAGWNTLRLGIRGVGMAFKTMFGPMSLLMMGMSFAADYIIDHWDKIRPYFEGLWNGVKKIFNVAIEWLKPLVEKFSSLFSPVINGLKSIGDLASKGLGFFGDIMDRITGGKEARERKAKQRAEEEERKKATAIDPEFEKAIDVKTAAQRQQMEAWGDEYAGKDYKTEKERDKQERKARKQSGQPARRQPASRQSSPASQKPDPQIVQPQVQVSVNVTQNGIPEQSFANGVMTAIRNRQAELEKIISGIVNEQARLAYG